MKIGQRRTSQSSASHKALALFALLLFGRRPYSLTQLAEHLECSRQTVLRLIDEISCAGSVPIQQWKDGGQNWYQLAAPEQKVPVTLQHHELQQLIVCRDFMQHLLPPKMEKSLNSAVAKAACLTEGAEAITKVGGALPKGRVDYTSFDGILRALLTAQQDLQVVEIDYLARCATTSRIHCFVPVRLVTFNDGMYVRGWTVNDKGTVDIVRPMTLAVNRMRSLIATRRYLNQQTHERTGFPPESGHFGIATQEDPFEVCVRFYPPASVYVKERIWSSNQRIDEADDGSIVLTFTSQSEYEVIKWVLSFGEEAEVIAPQAMVTVLNHTLNTMQRRYATKFRSMT